MLNQRKKSLFGSSMLLICAFIWGFAFVAQSTATDTMNPVAFNGIRYAQASIVVALLVIVFDFICKKRGKDIVGFNKETVIGGVICGVALLLASDVQQYGIAYTAVGKASFITVLYIVIVPIMGLTMRKKPSVTCRFAIIIAIAGFYLMSIDRDMPLTDGDLLILLCSLAFSFQMTFIDIFSKDTDPLKLTLVQFVTCAALSVPLMAIFGFPTATSVKQNMWALLYVGVMSAGVGITLQTIGQKYTEASVATLLMSLESIVGLIGAILILHEGYTTSELAGCLLVFIAVFLAEYRLPKVFLTFDRNNFALTERSIFDLFKLKKAS